MSGGNISSSELGASTGVTFHKTGDNGMTI